MSNYKADITLNEQDSLIDLLNVEKQTFKMYATCLTEGVSKGFRNTVKTLMQESADDQFNAFSLLTENDYAKVTTAEESEIKQAKDKFCCKISELS
ncbi:MAG: spore coat protein [Clostridia bacterium]|nr:spore coat protein [Clostridia bacterium]